MLLCPQDPELTPTTRAAVIREVRRIQTRRDATAHVATMNPRHVAHLKQQFAAAEAEAQQLRAHSRPGHLCLDCSQGI